MAQEPTPVPIDLDSLEVGGYSRLAEYMGQQPQLSIFRRFGTLTNANLLYLQAELTDLERQLEFVQKQDNQSNDDARRRYFRSWYQLSESAGLDVGSPEREQYELIMKLRKLMDQYHQALYFHNAALALRTPHIKILGDLREWMRRPTMGFIHILSMDWRTWEYCDKTDMITFENSPHWEAYSCMNIPLIERRLLNALFIGNAPANRRSIARFTQTFTVLIACTLPIAGIVVLYNVHDMAIRLGIIAALTGLFSTSMSILTTASLQEIFSATAAFAAVLVFFLGSTNTGP